MADKVTAVVDATVNGISVFRGKTRISLEVPIFKSDYPTECSDFPEGFDSQVGIGQTHRFQLERQNKVARKNGPPTDGSKPFHYYWGIVGLSDAPTTPESELHARTSTPAPSGLSDDGLRNDPAGISIERQTAYKGAVELWVAKIKSGAEGVTMDMVLEDAEKAVRMIHGGPVTRAQNGASSRPPADESHDAAQAAALDQLGTSPADDGEMGNLGSFLNRAMAKGHGDSRAVLRKLGVEKPVQILEKYGTFRAAWEVLAKP